MAKTQAFDPENPWGVDRVEKFSIKSCGCHPHSWDTPACNHPWSEDPLTREMRRIIKKNGGPGRVLDAFIQALPFILDADQPTRQLIIDLEGAWHKYHSRFGCGGPMDGFTKLCGEDQVFCSEACKRAREARNP